MAAIIVSYDNGNHLSSSRHNLVFPLLRSGLQQAPTDSSVCGPLRHSFRVQWAPALCPSPSCPVPSHPSLSILPGSAPTEQHLLFSLSQFPAHTPSPSQQPRQLPQGTGPIVSQTLEGQDLELGLQARPSALQIRGVDSKATLKCKHGKPPGTLTTKESLHRVLSMETGKLPDPKF